MQRIAYRAAKILRQQVSREGAAKARTTGTTQGAAHQVKRRKSEAARSMTPLRQRMIEAVGRITEDDPRRQQKIARAFVEQALQWELGGELANDPRFSEMVLEISEMLEQDAPIIEHYLSDPGSDRREE